tara:strand:- start:304 stop:702 length:399 start_codon:yes stop_codon:yes gene_type:complete
MKLLLASLMAVTPVAAFADEYQPGYSSSRSCFKTEYREEYIPGNADNPGYVQSFHETIEVPCKNSHNSLRTGGYTRKTTIEYDNNDCTDGKIAGGLLGGGAAAAMSRGDGRWWAIPLGIVVGSRIGCEVEGG